MRVAVALLALAVAAGAGCGGGSSDTGAAKRTINADSQRRAKSMLLRLSDFPEGWRASAPDPVDKGGQANLRKCVGVDFFPQNVTGKATSPDFATGQTTDASSGATIVGSPAQAQDSFEQAAAVMSGPKVRDCVTKLFPPWILRRPLTDAARPAREDGCRTHGLRCLVEMPASASAAIESQLSHESATRAPSMARNPKGR
jgi:hypothetical protein